MSSVPFLSIAIAQALCSPISSPTVKVEKVALRGQEKRQRLPLHFDHFWVAFDNGLDWDRRRVQCFRTFYVDGLDLEELNLPVTHHQGI
jgi:hypothetical protein